MSRVYGPKTRLQDDCSYFGDTIKGSLKGERVGNIKPEVATAYTKLPLSLSISLTLSLYRSLSLSLSLSLRGNSVSFSPADVSFACSRLSSWELKGLRRHPKLSNFESKRVVESVSLAHFPNVPFLNQNCRRQGPQECKCCGGTAG